MKASEIYYEEYLRLANYLQQIEKMSLMDDNLARKIEKERFKELNMFSVLRKWALIGLGIMVPVSGFAWLVSITFWRFAYISFAGMTPSPQWYKYIRDGFSFATIFLVFVIGYLAILFFTYLFTKDHNERGAVKIKAEKDKMIKDKVRNRQDAVRIYKIIRERIQREIPKEFRSSEDIRRIANCFLKYDLTKIQDAVAYYEKDLKNGVYG